MLTRLGTVASVVSALMLAGSCGHPSTPTEESSSVPGSAPVILDLTKLPAGGKPKIGYVADDIHLGKRTLPLAGAAIGDVAVLGDRWITSAADPSTQSDVMWVREIRTDKVVATFPNAGSRLVTNRKRNIVAWADDEGTVWVLQDGERKPVALTHPTPGKVVDVAAVRGNDCLHGPEEVVDGGCSVYFTETSTGASGTSSAMVASSHGFTDKAGAHIGQLMDVSADGALAGIRNPTSRRMCARFESEKGSYDRCDFVPSAFSPDGTKLIGYPPVVTEGPATNAITVRGARTGDTLLTIRSPEGTYSLYQAVWEDDAHLLVSVVQGEASAAIVRIGLNGKSELAWGPRTDTLSAPTFVVQP
jgi:hypothetical protein